MKIRLEFLEKAYSEIMDVPEETGYTFRMVLKKPVQIANRETGILSGRPLNTVCIFEWCGYFDGDGFKTREGDRESVRIYELRDIEKI